MQRVSIVKTEIEWEALACQLHIYDPGSPETDRICSIIRKSTGYGNPFSYSENISIEFPEDLYLWMKRETYLP